MSGRKSRRYGGGKFVIFVKQISGQWGTGDDGREVQNPTIMKDRL